MSHMLKALDPQDEDYDDYSDDDYYDDEEEEEEEQQAEEEEEEEKPITLLDLANKRKVQPKKQKQPKQPSKPIIKYADAKEKEYYDNLLLDKETVQQKTKALENVNFRLSVRESVMMNFDSVKPKRLIIQTINEEWKELYRLACNEVISLRRENRNRPSQLPDLLKLEKLVRDKNGHVVQKFHRKTLNVENSIDNSNVQYCFKRSSFAATELHGRLWVHGGSTSKSLLNDLWSYDLATGDITTYPCILDNQNTALPHLEGHQMIPIYRAGHEGLLIIGYSHRTAETHRWDRKNYLQLYYIHDVNKPDDIHAGGKHKINSTHEISYHYSHPRSITVTIPPRVDFSATLVGVGESESHHILIFGGRVNGNNATSNLYSIVFDPMQHSHFGTSTPQLQYTCHAILKLPKANTWPSPRFGHAAAAINGNLIIFGGKDGSKVYNDMFYFNTRDQIWTEIDIRGTVPPALVFPGVFSYSVQNICIYGGMKADGTVSNSIYSYDTGNSQWNVIKVMGHGSSANSSAEQLQVPSYNSQCLISGMQMYRLGGRYMDKPVGEIVSLSNIQDPGHSYSLCDYLRKVREEQILADVVFRVKELHDSEKNEDQLNEADVIHEFYAHRAILFARCPYLTNLVNESTNITESEEQTEEDILTSITKVIVDIDDCNAAVFDAYLQFLYTGEISLSGLTNINQLVRVCEQWCPDTHFPLISEICSSSGRIYLDLTEKVIAQIEQDFEKLLNNEESFTDLVLVLGHEEEVQELINVHKVLICRSQYFKNMLRSGMQESYAESIPLPDFQRESMLEILRYCYTDKIHVTTENAIGLMMTSSMFQLPDVSHSCRNLVGQCLKLDNVCQVMEIAETYQDNPLKRVCYPFMRDHYNDLCHMTTFTNLSHDTQTKVQEMALKKKKQQRNKQV
jgi:hypothetical protein